MSKNIDNKDSEQNSVHLTSNYVDTCPSWWISTGSNLPQSYPKNFHMTMDPLRQHSDHLKHLGRRMADQDSSSTQSTDQSHQELSGSSEGNLQEQRISAYSGILILYLTSVGVISLQLYTLFRIKSLLPVFVLYCLHLCITCLDMSI